VDPHQPAYWLSRDPADAALFLARTAVASRAVGGFVKSAQGEPSWWSNPELQKALGGAALGAGVGGLGGLGVGLFSRRKKNPLTSALTGAALGGVLGGALPTAYTRGKAWLETPPGPTGPELGVDQAQAKLFHDMPWYKKLWYKMPLVPPPAVPPGPTPASQLSAYEQEKANTRFDDAIGGTIGEAGKWGLGTAGGILNESPAWVAAHTGIGIGQGFQHHLVDAPAQLARDVRAGMAAKAKGTVSATNDAGVTTTATSPTLSSVLGNASRQARPSLAGRLSHPVSGRQWSLDADVGRTLRDILNNQAVPTNVPAGSAREAFMTPHIPATRTNAAIPAGYKLSPLDVQLASEAGSKLRLEKGTGLGRGFRGTLRVAAPHLLWDTVVGAGKSLLE
jgi:hypothetical protein